jgi:hypothetical protein
MDKCAVIFVRPDQSPRPPCASSTFSNKGSVIETSEVLLLLSDVAWLPSDSFGGEYTAFSDLERDLGDLTTRCRSLREQRACQCTGLNLDDRFRPAYMEQRAVLAAAETFRGHHEARSCQERARAKKAARLCQEVGNFWAIAEDSAT